MHTYSFFAVKRTHLRRKSGEWGRVGEAWQMSSCRLNPHSTTSPAPGEAHANTEYRSVTIIWLAVYPHWTLRGKTETAKTFLLLYIRWLPCKWVGDVISTITRLKKDSLHSALQAGVFVCAWVSVCLRGGVSMKGNSQQQLIYSAHCLIAITKTHR